MSNEELYRRARSRVQSKVYERRVTDDEIIIEQEKEIEYYRDKINKLTDKDKKKNNKNSINIEVHLEADEAIHKLREVNKLLEDIKNKKLVALGIDCGQEKNYSTICTYQAGVLVKEETTQYK